MNISTNDIRSQILLIMNEQWGVGCTSHIVKELFYNFLSDKIINSSYIGAKQLQAISLYGFDLDHTTNKSV